MRNILREIGAAIQQRRERSINRRFRSDAELSQYSPRIRRVSSEEYNQMLDQSRQRYINQLIREYEESQPPDYFI